MEGAEIAYGNRNVKVIADTDFNKDHKIKVQWNIKL
jgi:hypothetical protein